METATTQSGSTKAVLAADHRSWEAAIADLAKIEAEDEAFSEGFYKAHSACSAECSAVPHVTFPPEAYTGWQCQTTASPIDVARARREVAALDEGRMHLDPLPGLREHYEIKRQLVNAADERDRQIQAIRDRYDMDRLDDLSDDLGERKCVAWEALMSMPAPDLAALRWKLDHLTDGGTGWPAYSDDYTEQLRADIACLLPQGA